MKIESIMLFISVAMTMAAGYWNCTASVPVVPLASLCLAWSLLMAVSVLFLMKQIEFPRKYYSVSEFEVKCYQWASIKFFKKIIRRGFLHMLAPQIEIKSRNFSFETLKHEMKKAETIHSVTMLLTLAISALLTIFGKVLPGLLLIGFGSVINVYPIMLQRYNRFRLERVDRQRRNVPCSNYQNT